MKNTYIVSRWGETLAVGLIGTPEEVERDINLAHNLFNCNSFNDSFNGRINFSCLTKFYKFLLYKYLLPLRNQGASFKQALKEAKKKVLENRIIFKDFMLTYSVKTYNLGTYQDGDFGYEFED